MLFTRCLPDQGGEEAMPHGSGAGSTSLPSPGRGASRLDHEIQLKRLGQNLYARWSLPGPEDLLPKVQVLLGPEHRGAKVSVDPAGQSRKVVQEVADPVPKGVGQWA